LKRLLHRLQIIEQLLAEFEIQPGQGIVQHEDFSMLDNAPRNRHALLFAAAQLIWSLSQQALDLEQLRRLLNARLDFLLATCIRFSG